jgi:hypothetical protein
MNTKQIGRLAMRQERGMWCAYFALPESMEDAVFLGSIQMAFVQDEKRRTTFLELMRESVGDILAQRVGSRPTWPNPPQPAPEHERQRPRPSDAKLAAALREAGLEELAGRAEQGHYNEFFGPLGLPELHLAAELACIATPAAMAVRQRLINGEFDADSEESEEWAKSPQGQAAMRLLAPERK